MQGCEWFCLFAVALNQRARYGRTNPTHQRGSLQYPSLTRRVGAADLRTLIERENGRPSVIEHKVKVVMFRYQAAYAALTGFGVFLLGRLPALAGPKTVAK